MDFVCKCLYFVTLLFKILTDFISLSMFIDLNRLVSVLSFESVENRFVFISIFRFVSVIIIFSKVYNFHSLLVSFEDLFV